MIQAKPASDSPERKRVSRVIRRCFLDADIIPAPMPITSAITIAIEASWIVTGNF
jgi:hypothetical protein